MKQEKLTAKIEDYGIKEVNDKMVAEIYFRTTGETAKSYRWTGWLTEAGFKGTSEVLATCGLTGNFAAVADGPSGGALDMATEYQITVQPSKDKDGNVKADKNGNPYMEVRFVNKPRASKFDEALKTQAKSKLQDLEGKWSAFKAENNIKKTEVKKDAGF